jgi:hypothetical protein
MLVCHLRADSDNANPRGNIWTDSYSPILGIDCIDADSFECHDKEKQSSKKNHRNRS